MKSIATTSTWHHQHHHHHPHQHHQHHQQNPIRLRPIVLPSPPVKLANGSSLRMKSRSNTTTTTTKRLSPKQPLPSISTLFDCSSSSSTTSSTSSSTTSSYGSYCQFSPEGTYTMYSMPYHQPMYNQEMSNNTWPTSSSAQAVTSDEVHTPFNQPLFIQTSDSNSHSSPAYPTISTINANQLLLRPVPSGNC